MHLRRITWFVAALAPLPLASAEPDLQPEYSVNVTSGATTQLTLDFPVDDAHLANPSGYFPAEPPAAHVVTRVAVTNIGAAPLTEPVLRVDGRPYLSLPDPLDFLGLSSPPNPFALHDAWTRHRVHGTTGLDANRDPVEVIRSIGATFCGDDSRSLGRLLADQGIETRFAKVNGHSVAEYHLGNSWQLFDGDQNAFYLHLDNQTVASEADILADPFLVLRTRIYGRQSKWSAAHAWQNAARFEFASPDRGKKYKAKGNPAPTHWTFLPGETLTFFPDRQPAAVIADTPILAANQILLSSVRVAEFSVDLAARRTAGLPIRSPLPILSVLSDSGVQSIATPGHAPVFEIDPPLGDRAMLICQVTPAFIPSLRAGENELTLGETGQVRVVFQLNHAVADFEAIDPPTVQADTTFVDHIPTFRIDGPAERLWWQVSDDENFLIVPPNFDTLTDFAPQVQIGSALKLTFLTPGRKHYFRARLRRGGVWSDWSQPQTFMVTKPAQPVVRAIRIVNPVQAQIDFIDQEANVRIYGSNRLDFLPEPYADLEPTQIENNRIVMSRPNENFLGEFSGERGFAIVPLRRFYRLIADDSGNVSVPSKLAKLPPASNVPQATVLQNRHLKEKGALHGIDRANEQPTSGW